LSRNEVLARTSERNSVGEKSTNSIAHHADPISSRRATLRSCAANPRRGLERNHASWTLTCQSTSSLSCNALVSPLGRLYVHSQARCRHASPPLLSHTAIVSPLGRLYVHSPEPCARPPDVEIGSRAAMSVNQKDADNIEMGSRAVMEGNLRSLWILHVSKRPH
jgi:hypothetical protein